MEAVTFGDESSRILVFGLDILKKRTESKIPFLNEDYSENFSIFHEIIPENYFLLAFPVLDFDVPTMSMETKSDMSNKIFEAIEDQEPEFIIGFGELTKEIFAKEYGKSSLKNMTFFCIPNPSEADDWDWKEILENISKEIVSKKTVVQEVLPPGAEIEKGEEVEVKPVQQKIFHEPFIHLHVHDEYSLLDGFANVEDYAKRACERGWKHLAITNHGIVGQIPRQFAICKELGLNPIYGCEVYVNDNREKDKTSKKDDATEEEQQQWIADKKELSTNNHLILIAKNNIGFKNLITIVSDAWVNGFYRKPRTTHSIIEEHKEGLICGSACLGGKVSKAILNGELDKAREYAKHYKDIFGEDFYLELMLIDIKEQFLVNAELIKISKELNIPLVITNDCHYVHKDDSYYQDILLLLQNNKNISDLQKEEGKKIFQFHSKELWFKTAEELEHTRGKIYDKIVSKEIFNEAKNNAIKFAEKCKVDIDTTLKIPKFIPKDTDGFTTTKEYLERHAWEGLRKRMTDENGDVIERISDPNIYKERLEGELKVIDSKGFTDYFLVVKDMVDFARSNNITVGPGRGSAGGSLLCYALHITDVDPIRFGLFFERFLNEARQDLPDIDMDFEPEGREKIKDYLIQRYGREHTCSIGTYGSYMTKAAISDICRVFEIPLAVSRGVTKSLPTEIDTMTKEEAEADPEMMILLKALKEDNKLAKIMRHGEETKTLHPYDVAWRIRGKIKNLSAHAAGFIISNVDLSKNLPLAKREGNILSQWIEGKRGAELSRFGYVKWDILGLMNLTFIRETIELIKTNTGKTVDIIKDIDRNFDDPNVYKDLRKGKSNLIFQFESPLFHKLLKDADCDNFDTLAAITALGRPGPLQSNMTKQFCDRKRGLEKYTIHPVIQEALGYTYGIIVFQEQIMHVANKLGGLSLSETDTLRKVLTKAKGRKTGDEQWKKIEKYKKQFVDNGKKYMEEKKLVELFDSFLKFASYGFNRSHAVCYTVISYRCAWLKTYYPREYICAVLRNVSKGESGTTNKKNKYEIYIKEAIKVGIKILKPEINFSKENFTIEGDSIRIGLSNIKGIGEEDATNIINNYPYASFDDFLARGKVNKGKALTLIINGVFDKFVGRIDGVIRYYVDYCGGGKNSRPEFLKTEHERLIKDEDFASVRMAKAIKEVTRQFTYGTADLSGSQTLFSKKFEIKELTDDEKEKIFIEEFGLSLSASLGAKYEKYCPLSDIIDEGKGATVGKITAVDKKMTTTGKDYHVIKITDNFNTLGIYIWGNDFDKYKEKAKRGEILYFSLQKDGKFDSYSLKGSLNFMEPEKADEIRNSLIQRRTACMNRIKNKETYLNDLSEINKKEVGDEFYAFGNVSGIDKKKVVRFNFSDEIDSCPMFMWLSDGEKFVTEVKDGDFIRLRVLRKDDFNGRKSFLVQEYYTYSGKKEE